MEIIQFQSFKELITTPVSENEYNRILQMLEEIYSTSFENQIWIGVIIDFLNDNKTGKQYGEYYLEPDFDWNTRRYTYRFISTEEDMPHSITDVEVQVLKKFNAKTPFILYDYEEDPTADIFDYLTKQRTLRKVLESIGMSDELKEHLCEYCFYQVKQEINKVSPEETEVKKGFNPELWQPVVPYHPESSNVYRSSKNESFLDYEPISERYQVPGLLPTIPESDEQGKGAFTKKPLPF